MKRQIFSVICVVLAILFLGSPTHVHAWIYSWAYGVSDLSTIEAFIVNDTGSEQVDFLLPGAGNFKTSTSSGPVPVSGWSGSIINPDFAVATGVPTSVHLELDWSFTGNSANQLFSLDVLLYKNSGSGEDFVGNVFRQTWNGSNFSSVTVVPNADPESYNRIASVPEPSTLLLLGSGLAGLVGFRRKFK
jgi:hypothetical protein